MASQAALVREIESLERQVSTRDNKLDRIMSRGIFIGGAIGGAALGAFVDLRFGTLWGFRPSAFIGVVALGLVFMDKVPRRHEETVMSVAAGMVAQTVYTKTQDTIKKGFFGGIFGK